MPVSTTSIYRVTVGGVCDGQSIDNVLDYKVVAGTTPGVEDTIQAFLDDFRDGWRLHILPQISNLYSVSTYEAVQISAVNRPDADTLTFSIGEFFALSGTEADEGGDVDDSDTYPTYVAVGARKITGFGGRANRGSIRFGTIKEDRIDLNQLNVSYRDQWQTALNLFKLPIVLGAVSMGLVVFPARSIWNAITPPGTNPNVTTVSNQVLDLLVKTFVSSQISRKRQVAGS